MVTFWRTDICLIGMRSLFSVSGWSAKVAIFNYQPQLAGGFSRWSIRFAPPEGKQKWNAGGDDWRLRKQLLRGYSRKCGEQLFARRLALESTWLLCVMCLGGLYESLVRKITRVCAHSTVSYNRPYKAVRVKCGHKRAKKVFKKCHKILTRLLWVSKFRKNVVALPEGV